MDHDLKEYVQSPACARDALRLMSLKKRERRACLCESDAGQLALLKEHFEEIPGPDVLDVVLNNAPQFARILKE